MITGKGVGVAGDGSIAMCMSQLPPKKMVVLLAILCFG